jgi:polyisoprenoid-binding protein YceI
MAALSPYLASVALMALLAWSSPPARAELAEYALDPNHTFVTFEIGHFGTSTNRGRFDKKEGHIQFDRVAQSGQVDLLIDMASVNTGTPTFDKFLQGMSVFDVATFPTARFVSTEFRFAQDQVSEVAGMLTLLGKTQPVVLKATQFNCYHSLALQHEVCGGDFETTLDRTQWGMYYGVIFGFPKAVHLLVQVEAIKR